MKTMKTSNLSQSDQPQKKWCRHTHFNPNLICGEMHLISFTENKATTYNFNFVSILVASAFIKKFYIHMDKSVFLKWRLHFPWAPPPPDEHYLRNIMFIHFMTNCIVKTGTFVLLQILSACGLKEFKKCLLCSRVNASCKENKQIDIALIKPLLSCRKDQKIRKPSHYW